MFPTPLPAAGASLSTGPSRSVGSSPQGFGSVPPPFVRQLSNEQAEAAAAVSHHIRQGERILGAMSRQQRNIVWESPPQTILAAKACFERKAIPGENGPHYETKSVPCPPDGAPVAPYVPEGKMCPKEYSVPAWRGNPPDKISIMVPCPEEKKGWCKVG